MDMSLRKYLMKLERWVPLATCQQALAAVEPVDWAPHAYTTHGDSALVSESTEDRALQVVTCRDNTVNRLLMERVVAATRLYVAMQRMPWLSAPANHSLVRFNRYATGSVMREHCDHITSLYLGGESGIPILSVLIQLNDNFTGGELLFFGEEEITLTAGSTLVFPANFLYPHRVEKVLSGTRYSCVSWAW